MNALCTHFRTAHRVCRVSTTYSVFSHCFSTDQRVEVTCNGDRFVTHIFIVLYLIVSHESCCSVLLNIVLITFMHDIFNDLRHSYLNVSTRGMLAMSNVFLLLSNVAYCTAAFHLNILYAVGTDLGFT